LADYDYVMVSYRFLIVVIFEKILLSSLLLKKN
jgi:hypothetical protein